MTLIDFGDFKLRFDPKEVRISIDGEMIDIGARREESFNHIQSPDVILDLGDGTYINKKTGQRFIKQKQSNQK